MTIESDHAIPAVAAVVASALAIIISLTVLIIGHVWGVTAIQQRAGLYENVLVGSANSAATFAVFLAGVVLSPTPASCWELRTFVPLLAASAAITVHVVVGILRDMARPPVRVITVKASRELCRNIFKNTFMPNPQDEELTVLPGGDVLIISGEVDFAERRDLAETNARAANFVAGLTGAAQVNFTYRKS